MVAKKLNHPQQDTKDRSLMIGLQKHEATLASLLIAGTQVTTASLVTVLQRRLDASSAVVAAHAAWLAAVDASRNEHESSKVLVANTRKALKVAFHGSTDALADFGLAPDKAAHMTVATRTVAVAKSKATRTARHTMGPKQKEAVKGDVTAVVISPVTAPKPAVSGGNSATSSGVPQATASPPANVATGAPAAPAGGPGTPAETVTTGH